MFIGHFAAAMAAKKIDSRPSLGATFFAAQWLDLLWPLLLLTGAEHVALATDPAAPIPLSFTDYPFSHSLVAVFGWSLLIGVLYWLFSKNKKGALLMGALVLSHWLLDYLVHIPDLPLTPSGNQRVGLGLWQYKFAALAIEMLLFFAGVYLYVSVTYAVNKKGSIGFWSLVIFLVLVHLLNILGPPPAEVKPIAYVGLSQWLIVWWAWWADKNRRVEKRFTT